MVDQPLDPVDQEVTINLTAWHLAKINAMMDSPSAAVYGTPSIKRMLDLHGRITQALGGLVESGIIPKLEKPAKKPLKGDNHHS